MRSLSVTSGKGGVGKTNVAVNLALALSQAGKRILLFDADLGLANVDVLLGLAPKATLADVVGKNLPLRDALHHVGDNLDLLPATSGLLRLEHLSDDDRMFLADELDGLSGDYDIMIVDTGAGIGDNVLFFNDLVDQVLLVTVPEPTALTDTYAMIKVLSRSYRVETMRVVVNQATSAATASSVYDKLSEVSRRFLSVDVAMAGALPTDPAVSASVQARTPALMHAERSDFARAIRALAVRLQEALDERSPTRTRSFFREWMARHGTTTANVAETRESTGP